tara:strand:+ start:430 stop:900 length:471 start_codon:yes stop_codon:yes gene_type:complete
VNKILPKEINNSFSGHPASYWGFILLLALMTWRSMIHLIFPEYGFHQIANFISITGEPDPMPMIYLLFSLWGLAQIIFCCLCWIVVFKYKELISLMYILFIIEWATRYFLYPLIGLGLAKNELYSDGVTPGSAGAPIILILLIVLTMLSLKESKKN